LDLILNYYHLLTKRMKKFKPMWRVLLTAPGTQHLARSVSITSESAYLLFLIFNFPGNGQINGFTRATEIRISFVVWFSWKFRSWMVLFGSLLDPFVSSFSRATMLSIFEFDWFDDFSTRILIIRFNGLETFFLTLIYKHPRSRFISELIVIFVSI
jgi:hypothetical protein